MVPFPFNPLTFDICVIQLALLLSKSVVYKFLGNSMYCIVGTSAKSIILSTGIVTIPKLYPRFKYFPPKLSTVCEMLSTLSPEIITTSISFSVSPERYALEIFNLLRTSFGRPFNNPKFVSISNTSLYWFITIYVFSIKKSAFRHFL